MVIPETDDATQAAVRAAEAGFFREVYARWMGSVDTRSRYVAEFFALVESTFGFRTDAKTLWIHGLEEAGFLREAAIVRAAHFDWLVAEGWVE